MRNIKSLHIFQIIVIKREENSKGHFGNMKIQNTLWECENPKVNVTQRSPWNSIYVTFSFGRRVGTSLLILYVYRLMRVDYSPHFI